MRLVLILRAFICTVSVQAGRENFEGQIQSEHSVAFSRTVRNYYGKSLKSI